MSEGEVLPSKSIPDVFDYAVGVFGSPNYSTGVSLRGSLDKFEIAGSTKEGRIVPLEERYLQLNFVVEPTSDQRPVPDEVQQEVALAASYLEECVKVFIGEDDRFASGSFGPFTLNVKRGYSNDELDRFREDYENLSNREDGDVTHITVSESVNFGRLSP